MSGDPRPDQSACQDVGSLTDDKPEVVIGLRRRRAASARAEPLDSGVRDPFDQLAGMPVAAIVEYPGYDVVDLGLTCRHGDECTLRVSM